MGSTWLWRLQSGQNGNSCQDASGIHPNDVRSTAAIHLRACSSTEFLYTVRFYRHTTGGLLVLDLPLALKICLIPQGQDLDH